MAPSRYWKVLVGGLIAASFAAASIGLRFFPHYFVQLYIPLAIGAAPWIATLFAWPLTTAAWATAVYSLAVCDNLHYLEHRAVRRLAADVERHVVARR